MRQAGFALASCGEDGPAAWRVAEEWNARWDEYRAGGVARRWPVGSVGAAFDDFRQTGIWATKKPRTQEDWERGWKYIGHSFGEVAPETIVLAQIDAWYRSIVDGKGVREGWRALKIWRALWQTMIALGYCRKPDPSKAIRRETPTVRQGVWQEGEVSRLVKGAWRRGYRGLACIIAVAWDGALSPVDVRKLTFAQMATDGQKIVFRIEARQNRPGGPGDSREPRHHPCPRLRGLPTRGAPADVADFPAQERAPLFKGQPWPRLREDPRRRRNAHAGRYASVRRRRGAGWRRARRTDQLEAR
jgi:hypothetical protein